MDNETKTMSTKELTQAVSLLVEREERRDAEARRATSRRIRQRRKEMEAAVQQLTKSIEVIKWCIVGITSVMVISLVIVILVVMEVEREAERIKGEVQRIQREAEMIRDKMRHPLESIGGSLGRRLDRDITGFLRGDEDKGNGDQ